jgi:UDPglucose 6-dehydrogenase
MNKKSILVVGAGFVGNSLSVVMAERGIDVYNYDINGKVAAGAIDPRTLGEINNISDVVKLVEQVPNFTKILFICLPTPMREDGSCDLSIVEGVLDELANVPGERIAVVKSTVPPGSVEYWNKKYGESGSGLRLNGESGRNLHVIHNPEFLTEANALNDFRNQNRIILGGPRPWINKVKQLFQSAFPDVPIIKTSSTTSEMVKYFTNIHLAARVVLSCEFYQLCNKLDEMGLNIDYDKVVEYAKYDKRLGGSHMNVPGENSICGARSHCFPKDLAALVYLLDQLQIKPSLMKAIQEKNLAIVPPEHRDWEQMVGRAVSKKE